jgi:orotidine-5'-phosphate decarboxylase
LSLSLSQQIRHNKACFHPLRAARDFTKTRDFYPNGTRRKRESFIMPHFADRLNDACRTKGNAVCVGLDPRWDAMPQELRKRHADGSLAGVARAFEEFCLRVVDLVAPLVPVVKPQSAFFELAGPDGMHALQRVLSHARQRGLVTILDGKRNDIASTATAYADAAFGGVAIDEVTHPIWDADALTVNPYLGRDAVEPFLQSARRTNCGVYVLVRTSNPGAGLFQDLRTDGELVFHRVAEAVRAWTCENLGRDNYGDVGAVVGATYPAELAALRQRMPEVPILVPGYGAQGGGAVDVAQGFAENGLGAIINSSRGIIASFNPATADWENAIVTATKKTIDDLADHTPMGRLAIGQP